MRGLLWVKRRTWLHWCLINMTRSYNYYGSLFVIITFCTVRVLNRPWGRQFELWCKANIFKKGIDRVLPSPSSIPKPRGSFGHHRWFHNQFSSLFSVFHSPLGLGDSRHVHSFMLSSYVFSCLPCLLPLSLCLARRFWPDLMNGRHVHITSVCVSLQWSGGLLVVRLPAWSLHRVPRW